MERSGYTKVEILEGEGSWWVGVGSLVGDKDEPYSQEEALGRLVESSFAAFRCDSEEDAREMASLCLVHPVVARSGTQGGSWVVKIRGEIVATLGSEEDACSAARVISLVAPGEVVSVGRLRREGER